MQGGGGIKMFSFKRWAKKARTETGTKSQKLKTWDTNRSKRTQNRRHGMEIEKQKEDPEF
jgi:hypothetical protein